MDYTPWTIDILLVQSSTKQRYTQANEGMGIKKFCLSAFVSEYCSFSTSVRRKGRPIVFPLLVTIKSMDTIMGYKSLNILPI